MARLILTVDDSLVERNVLSKFLGSEYHVLTAASGKEMFNILRGRAKFISAILLDLVMPEMDGYQVLRLLRENPLYKQIPVIISTSITDVDSQIKAMSLGANGYIFKPVNRDLLLYTLKNAIGLREESFLLNASMKDKLTGLPNRAAFLENAEEMIKHRPAGYYILSSMDIEHFKVINEQYGVDVGDKILKHAAEMIGKRMVSLGGICCRDSSDKFFMLYPEKFKDSDALGLLHEELLTTEFIGRCIKVRVGRYLTADVTLPVSAMCDRAVLAEESIRGRYDTYIAYYADSMRTRLLNEQKIVDDMKTALAEGEFEPWFQPQYNHATGTLVGAEALVRWKKDERFLSPAEFIPIFERNGFIYEMDKYIWEQVCMLLRSWLDEGRSPLPLSVNISRYDFFDEHFVETLTQLVARYDIPYGLLRLEVAESAFAEASGVITAKVGELIKLGFTVEIDDFGCGYSSLSTLKDIPASIIKLDMKFFKDTNDIQRSGIIVESIVRMAKCLGMSVIAEGVEEKAQADYLKSVGCCCIQAFYYARPMPVEEYEKLLSSGAVERSPLYSAVHNTAFRHGTEQKSLEANTLPNGDGKL